MLPATWSRYVTALRLRALTPAGTYRQPATVEYAISPGAPAKRDAVKS